jgi:hypothetical protein
LKTSKLGKPSLGAAGRSFGVNDRRPVGDCHSRHHRKRPI